MSLKPIAIYGAGGFGREVLTLIHQINAVTPTWEVVGFFDDGVPTGSLVDDVPVLGGIDTLNNYETDLAVALAMGSPALKKRVFNNCNNNNIYYPVLSHPSFTLESFQRSSIGQGTVILQGMVITTNVHIGDFVSFHLACSVGHDAVIGSFSSFMPGVNISGETVIEEGVYVGTGTAIINRVSIGKHSIIGAGACVTKNIPADCTAVGVPAQPIKFHNQ